MVIHFADIVSVRSRQRKNRLCFYGSCLVFTVSRYVRRTLKDQLTSTKCTSGGGNERQSQLLIMKDSMKSKCSRVARNSGRTVLEDQDCCVGDE